MKCVQKETETILNNLEIITITECVALLTADLMHQTTSPTQGFTCYEQTLIQLCEIEHLV